MNLFEEAKYIYSNRLTEEGRDVHIFLQVDDKDVDDISDWIFENDMWYGNGDGLILKENIHYNELIFSKNHERVIHDTLEEFEGEELLQELKKITGLDYAEYTIEGRAWGEQQTLYYPVKVFNQDNIEGFEDLYFGMYDEYKAADKEDEDEYPHIFVFDHEKRTPEEVIAAETGLPKDKVVIKKIKGYKQVPIYED